ncbi:MAG TPA: bifunctional pyr operon transcriptional regulator/uracil phosphoribosyltransferase PyrR [Opitutaceae bacterium]
MGVPKTIDAKAVKAALERLASGIAERHGSASSLWLLGVANGGVPVAERLKQALEEKGLEPCLGTVDISFHRDDIGRHPIPKEFKPTSLPGDVAEATVILVDDVLFTGRTIKAALDELFDHGRPARVELAVLADRGGRTLPIAPDYVGLKVEAGATENVAVKLDPAAPENDVIRIAKNGTP